MRGTVCTVRHTPGGRPHSCRPAAALRGPLSHLHRQAAHGPCRASPASCGNPASRPVACYRPVACKVQAQTVANFYLAFEQDLSIVPVLNKIDMDSADPQASPCKPCPDPDT